MKNDLGTTGINQEARLLPGKLCHTESYQQGAAESMCPGERLAKAVDRGARKASHGGKRGHRPPRPPPTSSTPYIQKRTLLKARGL